jgi:hypothetical protein
MSLVQIFASSHQFNQSLAHVLLDISQYSAPSQNIPLSGQSRSLAQSTHRSTFPSLSVSIPAPAGVIHHQTSSQYGAPVSSKTNQVHGYSIHSPTRCQVAPAGQQISLQVGQIPHSPFGSISYGHVSSVIVGSHHPHVSHVPDNVSFPLPVSYGIASIPQKSSHTVGVSIIKSFANESPPFTQVVF